MCRLKWSGVVEPEEANEGSVAESETQSKQDLSFYVSAIELVRHCANGFFHYSRIHHHDRVPWTAIQKTAVWAFADALLATDTQNRIHLNAAKREMILVRHPEHTILNRTVFNTGWRSCTSRTALPNDRKFFGFFLARRRNPFRTRLVLQRFGHQSFSLDDFRIARHGPSLWSRLDQAIREFGKHERI